MNQYFDQCIYNFFFLIKFNLTYLLFIIAKILLTQYQFIFWVTFELKFTDQFTSKLTIYLYSQIYSSRL